MVSCTGPEGAQGPSGPQGPQGEQGPSGTEGLAGPQGVKGDKGDIGSQGLPGSRGPSGTSSWSDGTGRVTTDVSVGIGTTNPGDYKLKVIGDTYGVYASCLTGYGELGTASEGVRGVHRNSGNYGQLGTHVYGVYGFSNTYQGKGVYGEGNYSASIGVYGKSTENIGVFGEGGTWDFYAGGAGTDYGPFTGGHEVKLSEDLPKSVRPGMIVSVTGETQVRKTDGEEVSFSSTLPTVRLSDMPNDSKVFGVIISESPLPEEHWYQADEGERFGIINALGEGRVWVTNINGDIEAGDYITTSAIAGYGQKQDDDLLHSYTLGKAIEDVDWSQVTETVEFNGQTYKIYAMAVVYTSG